MFPLQALENVSFALPPAVGARWATRGEVICICEDDGFQKHIQELKTIARYGLPVKIFILKTEDVRTLSARHSVNISEGGSWPANLRRTRFHRTSGSWALYKISAFKAGSTVNCAKIAQVLQFKGACICEVDIDKDQKVSPKQVFTVKPDGKWSSKPLEDMYPFPDRKELKENMFIDLIEEE